MQSHWPMQASGRCRAASVPPTSTQEDYDLSGRLSPESVPSPTLAHRRLGDFEDDDDFYFVHEKPFNSRLPSLQKAPAPSSSQSISLPPFREISRIADETIRAAHPPSPSPALSVYNSPTATYAWPGLSLASEMKYKPYMYVQYNKPSASSYSQPSTSRSGPHASGVVAPSPVYASSSRKRKVFDTMSEHESYPRSPSRSYDRDRVYSSSSSASGVGDICRHTRNVDLGGSRSTRTQFPLRTVTIPSEDSGTDDSSTPPAQSHQRSDWEQWVRWEQGPQWKIFHCMWPKPGEPDNYCGYYSKKQLVKRHIEATHMHMKPFVCDICGKSFPQKTSLNIHRSNHTGLAPHECKFHCGKFFKDPARRHKHQIEAHNYRPKSGNRAKSPRTKEDLERLHAL
ncbi:hypothetical protein BDN72DRAFT_356892 [Pluteus cervinus]|uniref:Uncharacterized protein n=1 Tax=Pluteus cervinus TaxID=181527 RepID=A0ACD3BDN2_9AGAR|nr:hypothetical protein BDN72DRAFT_356892 [Pluteus cervinus]